MNSSDRLHAADAGRQPASEAPLAVESERGKENASDSEPVVPAAPPFGVPRSDERHSAWPLIALILIPLLGLTLASAWIWRSVERFAFLNNLRGHGVRVHVDLAGDSWRSVLGSDVVGLFEPVHGADFRDFQGGDDEYRALIGRLLRHEPIRKLDLAAAPFSLDELRDLRLNALHSFTATDMPLGDAGLEWAVELPRLTHLNLARTGITDEGVRCLPSAPGLKTLDLSGNELTDAAAEAIGKMKGLEELRLQEIDLSDESIPRIASLGSLRDLDLSGTRITDTGLRGLRGLASLESLAIEGTEVTDEGLDALASLPRLKSLKLSGPQITDRSLKYLLKLQDLEELTLHHTTVGRQAALKLKQLPMMKRLLVEPTPAISVNEVLEILPSPYSG